MIKLKTKLDIFEQEIKDRVAALIKKKGVPSVFTNSTVLSVKDPEVSFNLGVSSWLVEISEDRLIDANGNQYYFDALPLDKLCLAIDSIL